MAVRLTDRLSALIGDTKVNFRVVNWLWYWLHWHTGQGQLCPPPDSQSREKMAKLLDDDPNLADKMRAELSHLVSSQAFSWIHDSQRQISWVLEQLEMQLGTANLYASLHMHDKEKIVAIVDLWQTPREQKLVLLKSLKNKWAMQRLLDKKYSWFEDDNEKIVSAWEFFLKNHPSDIGYQQPFSSLDDMIIFIDRRKYSADFVELFITKEKKKWAQKKYRKSQGAKTQFNFLLSEKAKNNLNTLMTLNELSGAKVVELLINQEAEKSQYLPAVMRSIRKLDEL
tara:strand:+ start:32381 stop:33229 length:849 start_codon:yes stop_codon:yes gene_type:complete